MLKLIFNLVGVMGYFFMAWDVGSRHYDTVMLYLIVIALVSAGMRQFIEATSEYRYDH